ncbi:OmpA family protein [Oleiagrimonas sp. MCCC 1A03011]|uniref:OmpA family protein n=1 Tax=Oleiagrimonas sp. MCCC 1A03011 TaxID=1926883 RepID=UPI000DC250C4|nr:OmpA family protein [Oleiagrimonas sp. MCCC 1A03011]RAP59236.1 flagellar motor protein MotB [Oleiagrimonas sp. MCCC 1A03011]
MKHKALYVLVALTLGSVSAAHAQDAMSSSDNGQAMSSSSSMSSDSGSMSSEKFDGRWYIAPTIGGYYNDTNRNTNSRQLYYGLGFGKFVNPNVSIDAFADYTSRDIDYSSGKWKNLTMGLAARFYGGNWDSWRPYALLGAMGSHHTSMLDSGWAPAAEVGLGLSKTINENSDFRVEAGYRYDWDSNSQVTDGGYGDYFLGLSIVSRFGQAAAPPPPPPVAPPPPPPPTCDQLDSDNDGVNNCDDKCPNTAAGTIVGPDGCAQKVVIDLRGVNFKFDRPHKGETDIGPTLQKPTSDSMDILNQAVDTLKRYPNVHVMVAGYTDSIGTEAYNQSLSERRAKIVYDYLTSHGVDASRLDGPVGHGESNPVASNSTDEGRARNRRTELQAEDQQ